MLACLHASGFSKIFVEHAVTFLQEAGVDFSLACIILLEKNDVARSIVNDFSTPLSTSVVVRKFHAFKNKEEDKKGEGDKKCYIPLQSGPGLHAHPSEAYRKSIYLLIENLDTNAKTMSGVSHTLCSAVVFAKGPEERNIYLTEIETKLSVPKKRQLHIYTPYDSIWEKQVTFSRPKDTVLLHGEMWTTLIKDVKEFTEDATWYSLHGIPHTRKFIFYGPPGNGKSSTVRALASELGMDLYCIPLTIARMDDGVLLALLNEIPPKSLLLIEDIDRIFDNHSVNVSGSSVTFAGILGWLDGSSTRENVITILTCNDVAKLDPALKRTGRIDQMIEFKNTNSELSSQMFSRFYPGSSPALASAFAKKVSKVSELPIAAIQDIFVRARKRTAEECVSELKVETLKDSKLARTTDRAIGYT